MRVLLEATDKLVDITGDELTIIASRYADTSDGTSMLYFLILLYKRGR